MMCDKCVSCPYRNSDLVEAIRDLKSTINHLRQTIQTRAVTSNALTAQKRAVAAIPQSQYDDDWWFR